MGSSLEQPELGLVVQPISREHAFAAFVGKGGSRFGRVDGRHDVLTGQQVNPGRRLLSICLGHAPHCRGKAAGHTMVCAQGVL